MKAAPLRDDEVLKRDDSIGVLLHRVHPHPPSAALCRTQGGTHLHVVSLKDNYLFKGKLKKNF